MSILKKIYDWCNFQGRADQIKAWKLPPKVDDLFDDIWKDLPAAIQNSVWALVKMLYDKYGPELAVAILAGILKSLDEGMWEKS